MSNNQLTSAEIGLVVCYCSSSQLCQALSGSWMRRGLWAYHKYTMSVSSSLLICSGPCWEIKSNWDRCSGVSLWQSLLQRRFILEIERSTPAVPIGETRILLAWQLPGMHHRDLWLECFWKCQRWPCPCDYPCIVGSTAIRFVCCLFFTVVEVFS